MSRFMIPELIARKGQRWNAGANKGFAASIMRSVVQREDIKGLATLYGTLQDKYPSVEEDAARRILRSGQHAVRNHRVRIAEVVIDLFLPTSGMDINYVKEAVFGIKDGAPIMENKHPAVEELFRIYNGPGNCPV